MSNLSELEYYLREGAEKFDINLTEEQVSLFKKYYYQLEINSRRFNLTTITGEMNVALKHFIDSLTCAAALDILNYDNIVDVGTGGGFPGLPLKILYGHLVLHLVDSQKKRIFFLDNMISELNLTNVFTHHQRAEDFGRVEKNRNLFDLCTSRAVASLQVLSEYCLPVVNIGGFFIAMKGSEVEEEIKYSKYSIEILGGKIVEVVKFKLPFLNKERNLVLIKKHDYTPQRYPRKPGIPEKRPIK